MQPPTMGKAGKKIRAEATSCIVVNDLVFKINSAMKTIKCIGQFQLLICKKIKSNGSELFSQCTAHMPLGSMEDLSNNVKILSYAL